VGFELVPSGDLLITPFGRGWTAVTEHNKVMTFSIGCTSLLKLSGQTPRCPQNSLLTRALQEFPKGQAQTELIIRSRINPCILGCSISQTLLATARSHHEAPPAAMARASALLAGLCAILTAQLALADPTTALMSQIKTKRDPPGCGEPYSRCCVNAATKCNSAQLVCASVEGPQSLKCWPCGDDGMPACGDGEFAAAGCRVH
jgi:hypothetical protein